MPVPAPATALLAKHFRATLNGTTHEATTPTGAAYIAALAQPVPSPLAGRITATGYGIGHRQGLPVPNILRVMLVETEEEETSPELLTELCANIDDMTPEQTAYLAEKLMEAGALDTWQESVCMKKGRLAVKVCAPCASRNRRTACGKPSSGTAARRASGSMACSAIFCAGKAPLSTLPMERFM